MISYSYFPSSPAPTASTERGTRWFHRALRGLIRRIIISRSMIASHSAHGRVHRRSGHPFFGEPVDEPEQRQPSIDPWKTGVAKQGLLKHSIIVRNFHRKKQQHNRKRCYFHPRALIRIDREGQPWNSSEACKHTSGSVRERSPSPFSAFR